MYRGKTHSKHLLVESVQAAKGPRLRTICSLGSPARGAREQWLSLAQRLQSALWGRLSPQASDA